MGWYWGPGRVGAGRVPPVADVKVPTFCIHTFCIHTSGRGREGASAVPLIAHELPRVDGAVGERVGRQPLRTQVRR